LELIPDPKCTGVIKCLPKRERERFMTWYETVRHNTFDFHKEMELYCDNDVVLNCTKDASNSEKR
jgi:hypothetical protein